MQRLLLFFIVASFLGTSCVWKGENSTVSGVSTRLTFLHTSDLHSRLFPFELAPNAGDRAMGLHEANAPFGGVARLGYLIKRERERSDRVLHLDSGDCFQGAPVFNEFAGEPEIRYQSLVGLDAAVIGNHEFDSGAHNLVAQYERWGMFDLLAANYVFPDPEDPNTHGLGSFARPYSFYNLDGLKVAVIGMANLGSLTSIGEGGNSLDITPREQNETLREYVNLVHPHVDLVVVLSHLGLTEDAELIRGYEAVVWKDRLPAGWKVLEELDNGKVVAWVPGVRGVDVILGGHLHVVLNPPRSVTDPDGREVTIAHSGAFAKFLGRLDVVAVDDPEFGGKRVVSHKYQVFPVDQRLAQHEDPEITRMLEGYLLNLNTRFDLRRPVAFAPRTILRRSNTGNGDSGLGNLVAESMQRRRGVNAEFSVTNTLGIRDNFYAGAITLEDMFNVFPFENTLTMMYLSGTEIVELVNYITERSASRGCQSQAQVAGISFTMNCGQVLKNQADPDAFVNPGEDIRINGELVMPERSYKMATNDYIAHGGSGFKVLKRNTTKVDTHVSLRDALVDWLRQYPRCAVFEAESGICDQADDTSQELCRKVAGVGRIPGQPESQGPFADMPCVIGVEDGRIRRKTAEGLGALDDSPAQEPQE